MFCYLVNVEGDVTGMTNSAGKLVISYTYDAWGRWIYYRHDAAWSDTLGGINPLLYRGYVYDHETGLYYLQSRYYDFNTHRFLNADVFSATGQGFVGNNMFAYCNNNPVNLIDPVGTIPFADDFFADAYAEVGKMIGDGIKEAFDSYQRKMKSKYTATYTTDFQSLQISKSYEVHFFEQIEYCVYLNYFSEHKDYFVGSTIGLVFEWSLHNVGYYGLNTLANIADKHGMDSSELRRYAKCCEAVDLGPTIYHDRRTTGQELSFLMKASYVYVCWPTGAPLRDLFAYWLQ